MIDFIIIYCIGLVFTAGIGALMMFIPLSWRYADQEKEKRRGARAIILSPVWPVLAIVGIKWVRAKARATLKEDET
jgi:hypothetical protein